MENENEVVKEILTSQSNYMKMFERITYYFFSVFYICSAITPIFQQHLLCQVYIPYIEESFYELYTPSFWLICIGQNIVIHFALFAFKFYICLLVNFICFGETLMQILKYKVRSLGNLKKPLRRISKNDEFESKKRLNAEIVSCIKMHIEIKEFVYFIKTVTILYKKLYLQIHQQIEWSNSKHCSHRNFCICNKFDFLFVRFWISQ